MTRAVTMRDREEGEPLAVYLNLHAEMLGADMGQRRRLAYAARLAVRADPAERGEAGRIAAEVRDELSRDREATFLAQAQGDARALEDWNDAGAKRVKSRDGLLSLVRSGALTETEANTALQLRSLVEAAVLSGLGSQLGQLGEVRGGASSSTARVVGCLRRAALLVRVTTAERAVASPLGVEVLRAVAVEGRPIGPRELSGGARRMRLAALKAALAKVRVSLAETGALRIRGT